MTTIDSTIGIMSACGVELLGHAIGRLLRVGEAALHHVRVGEEVQVVRVVRHPVEAVGRRRLTDSARSASAPAAFAAAAAAWSPVRA